MLRALQIFEISSYCNLFLDNIKDKNFCIGIMKEICLHCNYVSMKRHFFFNQYFQFSVQTILSMKCSYCRIYFLFNQYFLILIFSMKYNFLQDFKYLLVLLFHFISFQSFQQNKGVLLKLCHCNKTLEKNHWRKESFILALFQRFYSVFHSLWAYGEKKKNGQEEEVEQSCHLGVTGKQRKDERGTGNHVSPSH